MLDLDRLFSSPAAGSAVPTLGGAPSPGDGPDPSKEVSNAGVAVPTHLVAGVSAASPTDTGIGLESGAGMAAEAGHSGHIRNSQFSVHCAQSKPLPDGAFRGVGTLGTLGTIDFQGKEKQEGSGAPGGGAARDRFALHPAAVILALAYCRKVGATGEERAAMILGLEIQAPGDQVRYWHGVCVEAGLKPWEVLFLPAPSSGMDCTMCKHLTTRQMVGDSGRREFHWACGLGYLILESGRGTERIWIAPPECKSWERWYPSGQR